MSIDVGDYGEARFVTAGPGAPVFELQARRDLHRSGPVTARLMAPAWHPRAPHTESLGVLMHIDGGGLVGSAPLAARMLLGLRDGLHVVLGAPARNDQRMDVSLELSAMDMRSAFDEFTQCAHTRIEVAWHAISRTRITYEVDRHSIDAVSGQRLAAVARYIQLDPSISRVYVDGHTDASGNERSNYQLSKRRAETVARLLTDAGVNADKLVVRFHGAQYPVADNDTMKGKAMNRRTTIRLQRDQLAANP